MTSVEQAFTKACDDMQAGWGVGGFPTCGVVTKDADVDEDERSATTVITSEAFDRDREVILVKGLKLGGYRKNPVVLFMHDMRAIVGKSLWEKKQDRSPPQYNRVIAKCQFAETLLANEVYDLVNGKFMRAASVGLHPFTAKIRAPKMSEIKNRPELEKGHVIESAEMLEWSWVSIPANPQALTTAVTKGILKETLAYYEPLLRAVTDANPRKKPFVKVVSEPATRHIAVVPRVIPKVIVTPETIRHRVGVLRALKSGRL